MPVFHRLCLYVSVLPPSVCLFSFSVCLFFSHASVRSSVVEDPSPVSENMAPQVGHPSGQGPVPLSVICWYRVQSLSFSESCRSLEVKEPSSQGRLADMYYYSTSCKWAKNRPVHFSSCYDLNIVSWRTCYFFFTKALRVSFLKLELWVVKNKRRRKEH